jgi:hypothetical protein
VGKKSVPIGEVGVCMDGYGRDLELAAQSSLIEALNVLELVHVG